MRRAICARRASGGATSVFGSDYALEMYKPLAKRRFGYYALPILHGDALIGKADHSHGVLEVHALHRDTDWTPGIAREVDAEIRSLAMMLELDLAEEGRTTDC